MINIISAKKGFSRPYLARKIKKLVAGVLSDYRKKGHELNIVFCGNRFIHSLNRKYRRKDYATDVLSFSQEEGGVAAGFEGGFDKELGDVVVSVDKAAEQSGERGVTFESELARLCVHGTLHLLGLDHERSEKEAARMFRQEDRYMELFGR